MNWMLRWSILWCASQLGHAIGQVLEPKQREKIANIRDAPEPLA